MGPAWVVWLVTWAWAVGPLEGGVSQDPPTEEADALP
jgi:hypothetical protein